MMTENLREQIQRLTTKGSKVLLITRTSRHLSRDSVSRRHSGIHDQGTLTKNIALGERLYLTIDGYASGSTDSYVMKIEILKDELDLVHALLLTMSTGGQSILELVEPNV